MVVEVAVIGREDIGFCALDRFGGSRLRIVLFVPRFLVGIAHLFRIAAAVITRCIVRAVLPCHRHLGAVVMDFYDPSRTEEAGDAVPISALCHRNRNAQVWIIIERAHHVGEFAPVFPAEKAARTLGPLRGRLHAHDIVDAREGMNVKISR